MTKYSHLSGLLLLFTVIVSTDSYWEK